MIEEMRKSKKHYMILKTFYITLLLGLATLILSGFVYDEKYNIVKAVSIMFLISSFQLISMNVLSLMIKLKNIFEKQWILKISYLSLMFTLMLEMISSLVSGKGFGFVGTLCSVMGYIVGTALTFTIIYKAERKYIK